MINRKFVSCFQLRGHECFVVLKAKTYYVTDLFKNRSVGISGYPSNECFEVYSASKFGILKFDHCFIPDGEYFEYEGELVGDRCDFGIVTKQSFLLVELKLNATAGTNSSIDSNTRKGLKQLKIVFFYIKSILRRCELELEELFNNTGAIIVFPNRVNLQLSKYLTLSVKNRIAKFTSETGLVFQFSNKVTIH